MRSWCAALGCVAVASSLCACRADVEEGRFACNADSECPSGWFCVGSRCFSSRDVDAAVGEDASVALPTSDAATPCGARGIACCAPPSQGCGDALFCDLASGLCMACGGGGQPCCPASPIGTCREGECVDDTCLRCGAIDEPCCQSGASCSAGSCCPMLNACLTSCS